MREIFIEGNKA